MITILNLLGIFLAVEIIRRDLSFDGALLAAPFFLAAFGILILNGATVSVRRHGEQGALLLGYIGLMWSLYLMLYPFAPVLSLFELPSLRLGLWAFVTGFLNAVFVFTQRRWMKVVAETGQVPEELGETIGE